MGQIGTEDGWQWRQIRSQGVVGLTLGLQPHSSVIYLLIGVVAWKRLKTLVLEHAFNLYKIGLPCWIFLQSGTFKHIVIHLQPVLLQGWDASITGGNQRTSVRTMHMRTHKCVNMLPFSLQLYGYCYQDSNDILDTLTAITELGSPLEMIQLLQTSWEDRFRVCIIRKLEF